MELDRVVTVEPLDQQLANTAVVRIRLALVRLMQLYLDLVEFGDVPFVYDVEMVVKLFVGESRHRFWFQVFFKFGLELNHRSSLP